MNTKTIILALCLIIVGITTFAQNTIGYQSVVRKTDNSLATNISVNVNIQILQGSNTGTNIYTENIIATQTNAIIKKPNTPSAVLVWEKRLLENPLVFTNKYHKYISKNKPTAIHGFQTAKLSKKPPLYGL